MTTEYGLATTKVLRRNINVLRDRMEYLQDKQAGRVDDGLQTSWYIEIEVGALRHAISVMEADFDAAARLHQKIDVAAQTPLPREVKRRLRREERMVS